MNEVIASLFISVIALVGYSYLFVRQLVVARSNRDSVTPLRIIILLIFLLAIITLIPGIAFRTSRLDGVPNEQLRSVATITGSVNQVATLILIVVFARYRIKGE